jgi:hypothetical protein
MSFNTRALKARILDAVEHFGATDPVVPARHVTPAGFNRVLGHYTALARRRYRNATQDYQTWRGLVFSWRYYFHHMPNGRDRGDPVWLQSGPPMQAPTQARQGQGRQRNGGTSQFGIGGSGSTHIELGAFCSFGSEGHGMGDLGNFGRVASEGYGMGGLGTFGGVASEGDRGHGSGANGGGSPFQASMWSQQHLVAPPARSRVEDRPQQPRSLTAPPANRSRSAANLSSSRGSTPNPTLTSSALVRHNRANPGVGDSATSTLTSGRRDTGNRPYVPLPLMQLSGHLTFQMNFSTGPSMPIINTDFMSIQPRDPPRDLGLSRWAPRSTETPITSEAFSTGPVSSGSNEDADANEPESFCETVVMEVDEGDGGPKLGMGRGHKG